MAHDANFFNAYKMELSSGVVRDTHDEIFTDFGRLVGDDLNIVDLGCGSCEFHTYAKYEHNLYFGIDLHHIEPEMPVAQGTFNDVMTINLPFDPTGFVSLFSTELKLSAKERYKLYEAMFRKFPNLRAGMVSGIYHLGMENEEMTLESHGIRDFQTNEHPRDVRSDVFQEYRTYRHVPSKLFGPNVIEVWKFLLRTI